MVIDENEFFREITLRVCGNLDFECAMQECLRYLKSFMPADCLHLVLGKEESESLTIIAIAKPHEARRVNIDIFVARGDGLINGNGTAPESMIISTAESTALGRAIATKTGLWKKHSAMLMQLNINGAHLGNLVLFAEGTDRYTQKHLRLFSILNQPFAIALSNALRYDELSRLKDIMADDIQHLHQRLQRSERELIVGENAGLSSVMDMAKEVAPLDSPVLLFGETGVGKEVVANAIHRMSSRKDKPYVQVNCGAIPDTLIDSELFGHEKGAFTGAIAQKRGCFERAHGGTIFLDEVAEMPLQAQIRMLRVLQEKKIVRVGGTRDVGVDIRIIAATHQDLETMVANGRFRADLLFRLNVFPIVIPPLRDRKEDIPLLIQHFVREKSKALGIVGPRLAPGAIDRLLAHGWPGNVRELENVVERALILHKGGPMTFDHVVAPTRDRGNGGGAVARSAFHHLDIVVSTYITQALKETKGKIHGPGGAAELLGLNPSTLRHRMRKLGIGNGKGTKSIQLS
jgi:transcriptional regulator with GAF, ATPase, and Fis domain